MQEKRSDALGQDRNHSPFDVPDAGEQKGGVKVELLLGGFRIPGFIEYHDGDDQVTFTLTRFSHSAPGEV